MSKKAIKKATKGNIFHLVLDGGREIVFRAGDKRRVLVDEAYDGIGYVYCNGEVRLADGTELYAVLGIDEASSGEHCDTIFFLEDGTLADNRDIAQLSGKKEDDIFPYRYRYTVPLKCFRDHHVGPDGWSTI